MINIIIWSAFTSAWNVWTQICQGCHFPAGTGLFLWRHFLQITQHNQRPTMAQITGCNLPLADLSGWLQRIPGKKREWNVEWNQEPAEIGCSALISCSVITRPSPDTAEGGQAWTSRPSQGYAACYKAIYFFMSLNFVKDLLKQDEWIGDIDGPRFLPIPFAWPKKHWSKWQAGCLRKRLPGCAAALPSGARSTSRWSAHRDLCTSQQNDVGSSPDQHHMTCQHLSWLTA